MLTKTKPTTPQPGDWVRMKSGKEFVICDVLDLRLARYHTVFGPIVTVDMTRSPVIATDGHTGDRRVWFKK